MINEEVLSEKLKYLIQMNAKANQFNVEKIAIEFEYILTNYIQNLTTTT